MDRRSKKEEEKRRERGRDHLRQQVSSETMVRITAGLIQCSRQFLNPLRDRELDLRGKMVQHEAHVYDSLAARCAYNVYPA